LIKRTGKFPRFSYEGEFYKYNELQHILSKSPKANIKYQQSMRYKKTASISGFISIATLTYGLIEYTQVEPVDYCPGFYCFTNHGVLSFFSFLVSGTTGIVAIFNMIGGIEAQRRSINFFNELSFDQTTLKNKISLNIGIQQNGLGLVVIF
jgi:hypothetical protein